MRAVRTGAALITLVALLLRSVQTLSAISERRLRVTDPTMIWLGGGPGAETALVVTTVAPIKPLILERIYNYSRDVVYAGPSSRFWAPRYTLAVIVDETRSNGTAHILQSYFRSRSEPTIPLPIVFPTSESVIFDEYPKLKNYRWNGPEEKNTLNKEGECCMHSIMWQMFQPSLALFMNRNPQFKFAWRVEDDLGVVGRNDSLASLVRGWDEALSSERRCGGGGGGGGDDNCAGRTADLVAEIVDTPGIRKDWLRLRHTPKFAAILRSLGIESMGKRRLVGWECHSDAIQRHSRPFSEHMYRSIKDNVFQMGECFAGIMAQSGNFSVRRLSQLRLSIESYGGKEVVGWDKLTSVKTTRQEALREYAEIDTGGQEKVRVLLYHEAKER